MDKCLPAGNKNPEVYLYLADNCLAADNPEEAKKLLKKYAQNTSFMKIQSIIQKLENKDPRSTLPLAAENKTIPHLKQITTQITQSL